MEARFARMQDLVRTVREVRNRYMVDLRRTFLEDPADKAVLWILFIGVRGHRCQRRQS